ncbi:hypothetical protein LCGC14_0446560 [marine sediment metagenome]|uniref:Uncharacterized protein n=1 Tax=marine sediment metagenome TaxID=412755 RepID=A0A0F9V614_9ZZZZ
MKLAFISSPYFLGLCGQGDIEMCLAPLALRDKYPQRQEYFDYYKLASMNGRFVIMDNGAAEKDQVDTESLLHLMREIKPSLVVAPDTIHDSQQTIALVSAFLDTSRDVRTELHADGYYAPLVLAAPQGKTEDEYLRCAETLASMPEVAYLGLSKFSVATCFGGKSAPLVVARSRAADRLATITDKPFHLLGADFTLPWELARYAGDWHPNVVSNDSSFAYWYAMRGLHLHEIHSFLPVYRRVGGLEGDIIRTAPPVDLFQVPNEPEDYDARLMAETLLQLAKGELRP